MDVYKKKFLNIAFELRNFQTLHKNLRHHKNSNSKDANVRNN